MECSEPNKNEKYKNTTERKRTVFFSKYMKELKRMLIVNASGKMATIRRRKKERKNKEENSKRQQKNEMVENMRQCETKTAS